MPKIKSLPSSKDLRVFAIILVIGFLIIGLGIPFLKDRPMNIYLVGLAGLIFVTGMISPKILIKPREYWIKVGNLLGKINSTILFTLIYILIFSTVGLIFRIFKRDKMHRHFKKSDSTMVFKTEISSFDEPF